MPSVAIRHGFAALQDLAKMPLAKNVRILLCTLLCLYPLQIRILLCTLTVILLCLYPLQSVEFWKMLVSVIHALVLSKSWQSIRGMGAWVQNIVGHTSSWISAAESQAKSR